MYIYFIMLIVSISFVMLSHNAVTTKVFALSENKLLQIYPKRILYFTAFVPLYVVSAFRYGVGVDFFSYTWIFNALNVTKEETHVELGYILLNKLIGFFSINPAWLFIITSFIILYFFAKGIYENSNNVTLTLFLFISLGYFFYSMVSIRHFMALAIYFYAQKYMKKQEFIPFLTLILIASSFHKIALIAIPIYFILNQRYKVSYFVMMLLILISMAVLNKYVLEIIFTFVYSAYRDSIYHVNDVSLFNILLSAVATFLSIIYYKPLLKQDKSNIIYINSAFFMLMYYTTCWWIPTPTRIGHFGTVFFIILFPKAIACEKDKKVQYLYYFGITILAIAFMILMLLGGRSPSLQLLPYQTIFDL